MGYKILIADDEAEIRDLLHLYLEKDGYEVIEAADGAQALSALQDATLRNESIDLVILDVMMPGIDGYRVLRNIRENSNIPADETFYGKSGQSVYQAAAVRAGMGR